MYLILVGGGNVGLQLAKKLIQRGHEVLLMEKEASQAQRLANALGDEHVVHGDGCELHTQKTAGFNRADVVVAVTGEDEDNLVCCQLAKEYWHVKRVVARVNDPSHEQIFRDIGIDDTVSATGILFSLIDQQISADELIPSRRNLLRLLGTRRGRHVGQWRHRIHRGRYDCRLGSGGTCRGSPRGAPRKGFELFVIALAYACGPQYNRPWMF
jgi:TrkA-N domain